ncbi:MAG: AarF/ABC1/UbiB kinase family protein [Ignavibacteriae bacterium]|nr:MAG: AarF/ABC1/UbiB kinase family protein [Ignavibacteriota bacterium]
MGISIKPEYLKRYKDLGKLLIKYGREDIVTDIGIEQILKDDEEKKESNGKAEELPKDLEKLGPTYVKLGQFLSTRSDMMPVEYMDALAKLQDKVEEFPYEEVEKIILNELGVKVSKAFAEFDPKPIGAASIGQVHKAKLRDGRDVIVKVQRPDIRDEVVKDLDAFDEIAEFLEKHTDKGKQFMLHATLEEFRKATLKELDYRNEAQNLKVLNKNLEEFKDIVVPLPVENFTTSRVITMDYITGKKVTSISPLRQIEIDGDHLADELFKAYLKQILIDGFYHCDPHPGNVFLTNDNKIALLDLGMVAYISEEMQKKLFQILIAISEGRGAQVADHSIDIGIKEPNFNEEEFRRKISDLVSAQQNMTIEKIETGRLVLQLTKISGASGIHVPNELTMLGKTLLNLDKIGRTLAPRFDPNKAIRKNTDDLIRKKIGKVASSKKPYEILLEAREFFELLPNRVNKVLDNLSRNKFTLQVESIDEQYLMTGFQKIANRLTMGLIIAALIVGAALLTRVDTNFTIFGYPGLAIIFFLLAATGGIILSISILFGDEPTKKKEG